MMSPAGPLVDPADQVEDVIVATVEYSPGKDTHWSRASMTRRTVLTKSTVGRIWRRFDLKPHLQDSFKLSTDPFFVDKVVDVVGLYHNPPEKAVVLCVDEKSQIQALDRSQPVLPMMPGMPERRRHDYLRHGITSLFAAFNIADGSIGAIVLTFGTKARPVMIRARTSATAPAPIAGAPAQSASTSDGTVARRCTGMTAD